MQPRKAARDTVSGAWRIAGSSYLMQPSNNKEAARSQ